LHLSRHIAPKCSAIHKVLPAFFRQSDEKPDGAIAQQSLCGVALRLSPHRAANQTTIAAFEEQQSRRAAFLFKTGKV
jgi:hypothetical protein